MGTLSKKGIKVLAALLAVIVLIGLRSPSAASSVIDYKKSGALTVQPKYDGSAVSGCTFDIYRVAAIDSSSPALKYSLLDSFAGAGVDLNQAVGGGAETLESAAASLAALGGKPEPAASGTAGGQTVSLSLGAYLVVQTEAPGRYTKASPFLVFIPYTNTGSGGGTSWVYTVAAYPKLGYKGGGSSGGGDGGGGGGNPPPPVTPGVTDVKVVKKWDDAGSEAKRPASIAVSLLKDGAEYASQTLSDANGWQCEWTGLSSGSAWTVSESSLPDGYFSTIDSVTGGGTCTYTITNIYEEVPLAGSLFVSKKWNDKGHETERPSSVRAGLYCDGRLQETVVLDGGNDWSHSWLGLDVNRTWTVSEIDASGNYKSAVEQNGSGFTITNTYGAEGEPGGPEEEIPDEDVPLAKAPQTGLVQWPIPVLLTAGAVLIVCGVVFRRKEKHG